MTPNRQLGVDSHDAAVDEDYFVNTLAPFARGSTSGNALLQEIFSEMLLR